MIHDNHFENMRNTINAFSHNNQEEEHYKGEYQPRLFTLISKNGIELALFISFDENRKRVLYLECKNTANNEGLLYREIFHLALEENQWYSLVFAYAEKNGVNLRQILLFNDLF